MTPLRKPLCAVLTPVGSKRLPSGQPVDFEALCTTLIEPAIVAAGMTPLRAGEEAVGGGVHAPLHERLLLCDYAVVDLSGEGAAAFYQLGLRDGLRPATTVTLVGEAGPLPLAPASPGAIPYAPAPPEMIRYALAADGRPADAAAATCRPCDAKSRRPRRPWPPTSRQSRSVKSSPLDPTASAGHSDGRSSGELRLSKWSVATPASFKPASG
mgnify:CR=1 FL=1